MALIDTTNIVESSMFLKSKLKKNMVGDNYYIESLQNKINKEWTYRFNVIDIDEENEKQTIYSKEEPKYTPTEAVIQTAKGDKGKDLGNDWKHLVFKDMKHKNIIGKRFRFSLDFSKNVEYTNEEKKQESSIWITVNQNIGSATNSVLVRRCNSNVGFVGSTSEDYCDVKEFHYEPCIIDDSFNSINIYYNSSINIPQAEIYITFQHNYFTKNIKINDRLIIGDTDTVIRDNNNVFKVKAVRRFSSLSTFKVGANSGVDNTPLVVVALDKDSLLDGDDLFNRIATQCPIYKITDTVETPSSEEIVDDYKIQVICEDNRILQEESMEVKCEIYNNNNLVSNKIIEYEDNLNGVTDKSLYYNIERLSNSSFKITNKKAYLRNKLVVKFCLSDNRDVVVEKQFILGGFY